MYFCSTNYQLNEFLLCAQPRVQLMSLCFQKNFVVYFFTEADVEINYWKYGGGGGTEFSHIFPPQYQEM